MQVPKTNPREPSVQIAKL